MPGGRAADAALVLLLAVGLAMAAWGARGFTGFAVNADTLYPALLAEELRAGWDALRHFRWSRIPSFVPDLLVTAGADLALGSWRWAMAAWGVAAFAGLAALAGLLGRALRLGAGVSSALAFAGMAALGALLGLVAHERAAPADLFDAGLPVSLHLWLLLPVFQGGAFVLGLAVVLAAWRAGQGGRAWPVALLAALGVASNTIVVLHAALPAALALADGAWRGALGRRAAWRAGLALALGSAAGLLAGRWAGREELPFMEPHRFLEKSWTALAALPGQPLLLLMLAAALLVVLAALRPAWVPRGAAPAAWRFFALVGALAVLASLAMALPLHDFPQTWRYANPVFWWPLLLAAPLVAARWPLRRAAALLAAALLGVGIPGALAGGGALGRWQPAALACLDRADPGREWRAGVAGYWLARDISAASGWRRQVEQVHADGRAAPYISDPRSFIQARGGPPGEAPAFRFVVLARLDPAAILARWGEPERRIPCGPTEIWLYPAGVLRLS